MYAVVGCTECGTYWLLSDPDENESATCPQCGRRHRTRKLRRFFESEDREAAREARARLLARKGGHEAAFDEVAHVADLAGETAESGLGDREFLEASGIDADEVEAAGDVSTSRSRSRDEVVRDALRDLDEPTEADVVAYASEHGVPESAAHDLLDRLRRAGAVAESGGSLRLL